MEVEPELDLLSHLIPADHFVTAFSTSTHLVHAKVVHVDLDDKKLGAHKVSSRTKHERVRPPASSHNRSRAPDKAWEAVYPKGSLNPSGDIPGGFGLYLNGPPAFAKQLETAKEAIFSYRMMLQDDWEWVKGGKLPGIFGGVGDLAYACTGGRQEKRCQCFDLRAMWRAKAEGELYAYLPLTEENKDRLTSVPPKSVSNNDYGISVGRGAFDLKKALGNWVTIAFRVKLNNLDCNDGELEMWVDGESVIKCDGLSFRSEKDGKIKGMHFQTFFGGNGPEWASPKEQKAWFSDITGAILC
ncbi:polysaccharide lyase family 14 protein [Agrocybe pediades]|nr:polysaccharide lyase family 14 protein [Agrocybe pediades]